MDELVKTLQLTHALKNQLTVVDKTLSVYSGKLPKNRLTEIGEKAVSDAFVIIKEISHQIECLIPSPPQQDNGELKAWIDKILENQKKWEEKFNLKLLFPQNIKTNSLSTSVDSEAFCSIIELFLENSAVTGSSAIEFTFKVSDKLVISIHDNGEGSLPIEAQEFTAIKNQLNELGIDVKINSIKGIGSGLICVLKLS